MSICILACGVFRDALQLIQPQRFRQDITIAYLTPFLHNHPADLKKQLQNQIRRTQKNGVKIICLYGCCYPDLNEDLHTMGIPKIPGGHCFEILLGHKRFQSLIDETAGTYFIEQNLISNFDAYCLKPLELDDPLMRASFFQHYTRIAYIQQPLDSDGITASFYAIAQLLNLKPLVVDADYTELNTWLAQQLTTFDE
jgi:hypothetical protein